MNKQFFTDQSANVIIFTPEQLNSLCNRIVEDTCNKIIEKLSPEWWTRKQVAQQLGCSISSTYNYERAGILKPKSINGHVLFNRMEVLDSVSEGGIRIRK